MAGVHVSFGPGVQMPNEAAGPVPIRIGAAGFESQAASPSAAGSTTRPTLRR